MVSEEDYCWNCAEGLLDGDCTCGEDTCCCLFPEPPTRDICGGTGVLGTNLAAGEANE